MKRKRIAVIAALTLSAMITAMITACGKTPQGTVENTSEAAWEESREAVSSSEQSASETAATKAEAADQAEPVPEAKAMTQAEPVPKAEVMSQSETTKKAEPATQAQPGTQPVPLDFAASVVRTSEDNLLDQASPETSALTLFTYDGKTVQSSFIYDSKTEQKILDAFHAVDAKKAEDWTVEDVSLPVYGIEIGRADGWSILAAWSNGYWIAQDGAVYQFDFDFESLAEQEPWEDTRELPSFTSFPCARIFTEENGKWNTQYLVPATPFTPTQGITMTLDAWEGDNAVVMIDNKSGEDWSFGEFFEVQALIGGTWYEIPTLPGNWGFTCLGYYLPDGESQSMTLSMSMYGDLPPGDYRIVLNGLTTDYRIP